VLHHTSRFSTGQADIVLVELGSLGGSHGSTEHILVLLVWEIDIIVSVWMWVFSRVVSIVLPGGSSSKISWMSVSPVLDVELGNRSSLVVLANLHGSLISLVIDSFSSEVPLSLLSESLKNVVRADLHD